MHANLRQKLSLGFILVALLAGRANAGEIAVVDQQNLWGGNPNSYIYSTTLFQTFTPTLDAIETVEVTLGALPEFGFGNPTVRLYLFEGKGAVGELLAFTAPQEVVGTEMKTYHFDFASSVALTPGNTYTLGIICDSPDPVKWAVTVGNQYGGGSLVNGAGAEGNPPNFFDLDFIEGLHGVTLVDIDIKPGSDHNPINNDGHGVIPVAILGSPDLDVTFILPWTVELEGMPVKTVGKQGKLLAHYEDVNGDGLDDLVVQILDVEGTLAEGATIALLTGELIDGTLIGGAEGL
jgi:hypothetical protein